MAITFLQSAVNATLFQSSYTFSSQNLGTAAADRVIIVLFKWEGAAGVTASSITIQGITATFTQANSINNTAIALATVPTGTTGDIVINLGVALAYEMGIGMYSTNNVSSLTPYDNQNSSATPGSVSINVPTSGFVVGVAGTRNDSAVSNIVWSGLTRDYFQAIRSNAVQSGASGSPSGQSGYSVTATYTGGDTFGMQVASFSYNVASVKDGFFLFM